MSTSRPRGSTVAAAAGPIVQVARFVAAAGRAALIGVKAPLVGVQNDGACPGLGPLE